MPGLHYFSLKNIFLLLEGLIRLLRVCKIIRELPKVSIELCILKQASCWPRPQRRVYRAQAQVVNVAVRQENSGFEAC